MPRPLLYATGWVVAVVVATSVGFAAVAVVTDDVAPVGRRAVGTPSAGQEPVETTKPDRRGGQRRRTDDEGPRRPRRTGGGGSEDEPGVTDATERPLRSLVTDGGSVTARCTRAEDVRMISWSPAAGWAVLAADPGPGATASVTFADGGRQVVVSAHCLGVVPLLNAQQVDEEPEEPTGRPSAPDGEASGAPTGVTG